MVSGSAALLLSQRPDLTPDQVKKILVDTSETVWWIANECHGAGLIDLAAAERASTPTNAAQNHDPATGLGSLEAARGSMHVAMDGVTLTGEQDIFGQYWDGASWSGASWSGASWSGGEWNGSTWTGASWSGASWSGASWSGASWSGASWSGASWSGASWSTNTWNGASWSGASWSGASWSGASWSSNGWLGATWE
jgi:serine protease AprX